MNGQGCWKLFADDDGRILDRIVGLEKVISPELVERALAETGKQTTRVCTLTNEVMIWVVLAMGLFTELPIRQVFKACRRLRHGEDSPARSSLCVARQRLGSEPLVALHKLVVRPLATPQTPGAFYRGMRRWRSMARFSMCLIAMLISTSGDLRVVVVKVRSRNFEK